MISPRREAMVQAFADYERSRVAIPAQHLVIGTELGTRLQRIVRLDSNGWMLWIATKDFVYGTYLLLSNDGGIERVVTRVDEGDEINVVRPSDEEIRATHVDRR
jgi:hypothetical protein